MQMPKNSKKAATFLLAGVFTLFMGGQVLAYNAKTALTNQQLPDGQQGKHKARYQMQSDSLKEKLDSLVKSGTITQAQEDKIISYMKQKSNERKAEMEKVKSMTKEQRKEYFKQKKANGRSDMFKDLVEQNIITQQQADTIKKLVFEKNKIQKHEFNKEKFKVQLDNQVKAGIITQDEENKIIAYMTKKAEERKAEMEKIKNMTKEEKKVYFEKKKSEIRCDFYKELVDQGILSQEKADALRKAMPQPSKFNRKHFNWDKNE